MSTCRTHRRGWYSGRELGSVGLSLTVCSLALCGHLFAKAAAAQVAAESLPLQAVLDQALYEQPDILAALARRDASEAGALAAHAPFDWQQSLYVSRDQVRSLEAPPVENAPVLTSMTTTGYGFNLRRMLSSGIVLQPQVSVSTRDSHAGTALVSGFSDVSASIQVPLLRDRGGGRARQDARAALIGVDAAAVDVVAAAAKAVYLIAGAYWERAASAQRVSAVREARQRAERLVTETEALVAADERPAADLLVVRANLAARQAAEASAVQDLEQARQGLLVATGQDIGARPGSTTEGGTELPTMGDSSVQTGTPAVGAPFNRLADYVARHPEIQAVNLRLDSLEQVLAGYRSDVRPRLDATLQLGYRGYDTGRLLEPLFTPLFDNVPGLNSGFKLSFEMPLQNREARARVMITRAISEEVRLARDQVRRSLISSLLLARSAVRNSRLEVGQAERALALYRQALDDEKHKFQMSLVTSFDVMLAEDRLTEAAITEVDARLRLAKAVLDWRFRSGLLVVSERGQLHVDAAALQRGDILEPASLPGEH